MRICSMYRGQEKTLYTGSPSITPLFSGPIRIGDGGYWNGNAKHYFIDMDINELVALRNLINTQLGGLVGVKLKTVVAPE